MSSAMLNVYSVPTESTSPSFAKAFAQGCGGVVRVGAYVGGDWAGFGSPSNWHDMEAAISGGNDWFYGDHGYFQRGKYYRITKNALFHRCKGYSEKQRIKQFYTTLEPWKSGKNVIICPQSDTFFRLRCGTTRDEWIKKIIDQLLLYTDRKIIVHGKWDSTPLAALLLDAHCVVSHSSNSAVDALMAGVPAITLADCPAHDMTSNSITMVEKPFYPKNRYEWAAELADNQWRMDEISDGTAWRHLQRIIQ